MNSPQQLEPIRDYTFMQVLGEGTSGIVWKAARAGREVAVKVLKPGFEHFVLAEFDTLQKLDHPNIIEEYEIGRFDPQYCRVPDEAETDHLNGRVALVMELLTGKPLEKCRAEDYSPSEMEQIVLDIAQALQAAHQQGVIHRDLKPANVFISPEKRATVLDFGVASGISRNPHEKLVAGSYSYMAPAQLLGKANLQNDIWSFGVTCYQFLTGQHPYAARTLEELSEKMLLLEVDLANHLNSKVPAKLSYVLAKCLRKNLRERYSNFDEILADLQRDPVQEFSADLKIKRRDRLVPALLKRQKAGRFWPLFRSILWMILSLFLFIFSIVMGFRLADFPLWPVLLAVTLVSIGDLVRRGVLLSKKRIENWLELLKAGALLAADEYDRLVQGLQQYQWTADIQREDKEYLLFWNWKHQHTERARQLADELLTGDEHNVTALNFYVQKHYLEKAPGEAGKYGERLLTLNPDDVIRLFLQQVLRLKVGDEQQQVDQLEATLVRADTAAAVDGATSRLAERIYQSGYARLVFYVLDKNAQPFLEEMQEKLDDDADAHLTGPIRVHQPVTLVLYQTYLETTSGYRQDLLPGTLPYRSIEVVAARGRLLRLKDHGWIHLSLSDDVMHNFNDELTDWRDYLHELDLPYWPHVVSGHITHRDGHPFGDDWTLERSGERDLDTEESTGSAGGLRAVKERQTSRLPIFRPRPRRAIFILHDTHIDCVSEDQILPARIAYSELNVSSEQEHWFQLSGRSWYRLTFDDAEMEGNWLQYSSRYANQVPAAVFAAALIASELRPWRQAVEKVTTIERFSTGGLQMDQVRETDTLDIHRPTGILLICRESQLEVSSDALTGSFPYETIRTALQGALLQVDNQWLALTFPDRESRVKWQESMADKPLKKQSLTASDLALDTHQRSFLRRQLDRLLVDTEHHYRRILSFLILYAQDGAENPPLAAGLIEAHPFRIDQEQLQLTFAGNTTIDFLSIAVIEITETHGTIRGEDETVFARFELATGDYAGYLPAFCHYFGDRIMLGAEPYPA